MYKVSSIIIFFIGIVSSYYAQTYITNLDDAEDSLVYLLEKTRAQKMSMTN